PWSVADGWRIAALHRRVFNFLDADGQPQDIELHRDGSRWSLVRNGKSQPLEWTGIASQPGRQPLRIRLAGQDHSGDVLIQGETLTIYHDGEAHLLRLHDAVAHAQDE